MNNKTRNKQIKKANKLTPFFITFRSSVTSCSDVYVNPFIKGNLCFEGNFDSMLYAISEYDIQKAIENYNKYTKG